jgi:hypothetical protein
MAEVITLVTGDIPPNRVQALEDTATLCEAVCYQLSRTRSSSRQWVIGSASSPSGIAALSPLVWEPLSPD